MRICLIASNRFPLREPFAGGLEAMTHSLASELVRRGHEVTVFAAPGSDPRLGVHMLPVGTHTSSEAAMLDVNAPPEDWMAEQHAYLELMIGLADSGRSRFDVIHNNSLHHLPVAMARLLDVPVLTTLHTPPLPWLESAITVARGASSFAAVSKHTATSWSHVVESTAVLNGVDVRRWRAGRGGGPAVWSGRMVPEKAPHLAIEAARLAGVPLLLAGPVMDEAYVAAEVTPRLGVGARHVGHLSHRQLAQLYGQASVLLMTPSWEEPYGLAAAEAMACGTPVAAFARGALPEVVVADVGCLAAPDDVDDLARAVREAATRDRRSVRQHAVSHHSLTRMVSDYECLYASLVPAPAVVA